MPKLIYTIPRTKGHVYVVLLHIDLWELVLTVPFDTQTVAVILVTQAWQPDGGNHGNY